MYNNKYKKPVKSDGYYQGLYEQHLRDRLLLHDVVVTDSMGNTRSVGKFSAWYTPLEPRKYRTSLQVKFQGHVVKAKVSYRTRQQPRGGARGVVDGFSDGSRRRILELFGRLLLKGKAVFLTLTWGDEYPDPQGAKNALRAFLERIRRRYGDKVSAIWRMEFQERGAPHFHLIFFNLPWIDKRMIQIWWSQIIVQPWPFTRIELIRSYRGVMSYASKYVAKNEEFSGFNYPAYLHDAPKELPLSGRVWGVFNRGKLPFAPLMEVDLPFNFERFWRFRDLAASQYPRLNEQISWGFTLYVSNARQWHEIFHYLYDEPF